jgi:hypothetical protein
MRAPPPTICRPEGHPTVTDFGEAASDEVRRTISTIPVTRGPAAAGAAVACAGRSPIAPTPAPTAAVTRTAIAASRIACRRRTHRCRTAAFRRGGPIVSSSLLLGPAALSGCHGLTSRHYASAIRSVRFRVAAWMRSP